MVTGQYAWLPSNTEGLSPQVPRNQLVSLAEDLGYRPRIDKDPVVYQEGCGSAVVGEIA